MNCWDADSAVINNLLKDIPLPSVIRIRRRFSGTHLEDPAAEIRDTLLSSGQLEKIRKEARIAVAAGSRNIACLPEILRTLGDELKNRGARPFIVPAMGSHGGARAAGQKKVLTDLGITEEATGMPVRSEDDVIQLGTTDSGLPAYIDRAAAESDGIILVNRIKPHTSFRGKYESGLMKMTAIGIGKQKGAEACHRLGFENMGRNVEEIGRFVLEKAPFLFGVALVENARNGLSRAEVIDAGDIPSREPELLEEARRLHPSIGLDRFDILVIDEIGKDIAGTGFDTNIAGRYYSYLEGGPDVTRLVLLDLTEKTDGNANGVGMGDFITRKLYEKIDPAKTYPNSLTTTVPAGVRIPMVLDTPELAVRAAVRTSQLPDPSEVTLVRIKNTLDLEEMEVSENLAELVRGHPDMEIISGPYPLEF
jgi:hypothetical protein